jgi:hypothetical protein
MGGALAALPLFAFSACPACCATASAAGGGGGISGVGAGAPTAAISPPPAPGGAWDGVVSTSMSAGPGRAGTTFGASAARGASGPAGSASPSLRGGSSTAPPPSAAPPAAIGASDEHGSGLKEPRADPRAPVPPVMACGRPISAKGTLARARGRPSRAHQSRADGLDLGGDGGHALSHDARIGRCFIWGGATVRARHQARPRAAFRTQSAW